MNVLPFHFCDQASFDDLRSRLTASGYQYHAILERRGLASMGDIEKRLLTNPEVTGPRDALDLLIFLFAEGGSARNERIVEMLGDEFVALLDRFELLIDDSSRPGFRASSVLIGPVEGLFTISDRWWAPGGGKLKPPVDAVYPATAANTVRFLSLMPRTPCKAFLDLCCGTAIAALFAAREFAEHAYAFDIAERSTSFAEFGRRLNGIENVTIKTGDLYQPGVGQQFDYITAHPPYIPALEPKYIFQDGGADGELIVRRVVEEAPPYLAPGGRLFMHSLTTDRKDAPSEQRIRGWLGSDHSEFDVALFERRCLDPGEFASRSLLSGTEDYATANHRREVFQQLGITGMPYGFCVIQRQQQSRQAFTIRRKIGLNFDRDSLDRCLLWETGRASGVSLSALLERPIKPACGLELSVSQVLGGQGWEPQAYRLRATLPFLVDTEVEPWISYLLGCCDGRRTGEELFAQLVNEGILEEHVPPDAFAQALAQLISGGFLWPPASM